MPNINASLRCAHLFSDLVCREAETLLELPLHFPEWNDYQGTITFDSELDDLSDVEILATQPEILDVMASTPFLKDRML